MDKLIPLKKQYARIPQQSRNTCGTFEIGPQLAEGTGTRTIEWSKPDLPVS